MNPHVERPRSRRPASGVLDEERIEVIGGNTPDRLGDDAGAEGIFATNL
jgi:hypothetical protein